MHYLITGAGGQLGREFSDYLKRENYSFSAYNSEKLDITSKSDLEQVISYERPTHILNCAAYTNVDKAEDDQHLAFEVNHKAVRNLARLCKQYHAKLIHFSTDYVYPGLEDDRYLYKKGYDEDHRKDPVNAYGESKLLGENEILASGCEHLIFRVSWLCGKYGHNFVKTMLNLGFQGKHLRVVNDQWGSPTFANEVVSTTMHMLNLKQKGVYNFSSEGIITWFDLASEALNIAGVKTKIEGIPTEEYPTRAIRPKFSKLNTDKIGQVEGINIQDWKTGLKNLIHSIT